jgi:EAL domain-containing protein (putative c-di-GMP-specific phosphodiesterase class I)
MAGKPGTKTVYAKRFRAGEEIFRLGDEARNAYIIENGRVQVSDIIDGKKSVVAEIGVGEIFGEMSMIDDEPRSATVAAIVDTDVVVIQRARFQQPLMAADPLMKMLLRVLLARFRELQRQRAGIVTASTESDPSLKAILDFALSRINDERELRRGLEAGEFELHYQPIVSLSDGRIAGFEALTRWRKPDGNYMPPMLFIPLAEETGMIAELGRWVLETAIAEQFRLAARFSERFPGEPPPFMSVNVSGLQLSELAEIDLLASIIADSGVDPALIKLEMTETLLVEDPDTAAEALHKIKELGVSIAIDDFGTGYSSLSYLHQFPLDTLKIDRMFVQNMDKSENGRRIVNSIVQLALALEMNIVAEGIEEEQQWQTLQALGCQFGQGYHLGGPGPADAVMDLLESWQPRQA